MKIEYLLIAYTICIIIMMLLIFLAYKRNDDFNPSIFIIVLFLIFSPIIVFIKLADGLLPRKRYKTYFDKTDTPYDKTFQTNKKYHIVWKRMPYASFFNHKVIKIKLFGIYTIYDITKGKKSKEEEMK